MTDWLTAGLGVRHGSDGTFGSMLDSAFWPRSSSVTNSSKLSLCVSNSLHVQILTSKCRAFSNLSSWSSLIPWYSVPPYLYLSVYMWVEEINGLSEIWFLGLLSFSVIHSVVSDRQGRLQLFIVLHLLLLCQVTQTKIECCRIGQHTPNILHKFFPLVQVLSLIITHVHILARCSTPDNPNPCCNLATAST